MDIEPNIADLTNEITFKEVFESYYQPLSAFAFQYLDDHDLAEETVQEMFTNIWQKASQISVKTSLKSYLFGAVRNACLNQIKHNKIVRKHEEHEKHNVFHQDVDFVELDELQQRINKALDELPEKCRQIFEMSRFEEKKYKEIAEELGLSIKTVENQMGRALKLMRTNLKQYLPVVILLILAWLQKHLWG